MEKSHEVGTPRWATAYLVCKACAKRKNGPKSGKVKALVARLRRIAKGGPPRARVLATSCLGLCPKSAVAVAQVGVAPPRIVAIASVGQLDAAFSLLGRDSRSAKDADADADVDADADAAVASEDASPAV